MAGNGPPGTVAVPEGATAHVHRGRAVRIFIGRFIVDWIETFAALIVGIQLFLPHNIEEAQRLLFVLATPLASASIGAVRRAWPWVREWLLNGDNGDGNGKARRRG